MFLLPSFPAPTAFVRIFSLEINLLLQGKKDELHYPDFSLLKRKESLKGNAEVKAFRFYSADCTMFNPGAFGERFWVLAVKSQSISVLSPKDRIKICQRSPSAMTLWTHYYISKVDKPTILCIATGKKDEWGTVKQTCFDLIGPTSTNFKRPLCQWTSRSENANARAVSLLQVDDFRKICIVGCFEGVFFILAVLLTADYELWGYESTSPLNTGQLMWGWVNDVRLESGDDSSRVLCYQHLTDAWLRKLINPPPANQNRVFTKGMV